MAAINIEEMLNPVSDEAPTGENLEYDPAFSELERAAAGKEERYSGGELIPAEDPDWKEVRKLATELFARTKDLRVAVQLVRSETALEGIEGLAAGTALVRAMLERNWDDVHPKLEPEDEYDPVFRINALATLGATNGVLGCLRKVFIVEHRAVGRFTLRDLDIAQERAAAPEGETPPSLEMLRGTLREMGSEHAQACVDRLQQIKDDIGAIDAVFREKAAGGQTPDLEPLGEAVGHLRAFFESGIDRPADESATESDEGGGESVASSGGGPGVGALRSREDVKRILDQVCDFLQRTEPSNPAPLLIKRARRMLDLGFMEIIQDLAPDALGQVQSLAGTTSQAEG